MAPDWLTVARGCPRTGGARLNMEAFELVLERFETSRLSDLS